MFLLRYRMLKTFNILPSSLQNESYTEMMAMLKLEDYISQITEIESSKDSFRRYGGKSLTR